MAITREDILAAVEGMTVTELNELIKAARAALARTRAIPPASPTSANSEQPPLAGREGRLDNVTGHYFDYNSVNGQGGGGVLVIMKSELNGDDAYMELSHGDAERLVNDIRGVGG
jgi:hypothetical protein